MSHWAVFVGTLPLRLIYWTPRVKIIQPPNGHQASWVALAQVTSESSLELQNRLHHTLLWLFCSPPKLVNPQEKKQHRYHSAKIIYRYVYIYCNYICTVYTYYIHVISYYIYIYILDSGPPFPTPPPWYGAQLWWHPCMWNSHGGDDIVHECMLPWCCLHQCIYVVWLVLYYDWPFSM